MADKRLLSTSYIEFQNDISLFHTQSYMDFHLNYNFMKVRLLRDESVDLLPVFRYKMAQKYRLYWGFYWFSHQTLSHNSHSRVSFICIQRRTLSIDCFLNVNHTGDYGCPCPRRWRHCRFRESIDWISVWVSIALKHDTWYVRLPLNSCLVGKLS